MIICVCNNVSEKKIAQAVDRGITTMARLRAELEVGTCCGKCQSCAKRVLRECLKDAKPTPSIMFHPHVLAA